MMFLESDYCNKELPSKEMIVSVPGATAISTLSKYLLNCLCDPPTFPEAKVQGALGSVFTVGRSGKNAKKNWEQYGKNSLQHWEGEFAPHARDTLQYLEGCLVATTAGAGKGSDTGI